MEFLLVAGGIAFAMTSNQAYVLRDGALSYTYLCLSYVAGHVNRVVEIFLPSVSSSPPDEVFGHDRRNINSRAVAAFALF